MAAPGNYGTTSRANDAGIVNKVQQASEDGSYMFGYENGDGSFRMENRDANGLVRGKYGYIDANGERQEFGTLLAFISSPRKKWQTILAIAFQSTRPELLVIRLWDSDRVTLSSQT